MPWKRGDQVLLREVYRGRVWAAHAATVVEDGGERTALYLSPGMRWKRPVAAGPGTALRMPGLDWRLEDATWTGARTLYLIRPGVGHAVHLWWVAPDWRFDSWYVNLQEPVRRSPLGFDYLDQLLDIVVAPDLSSWFLKDEQELAEACESGFLTALEAAAVRAEAQRVIRRIQARAAPFNEPWDRWEPDPSWPVPQLPRGWDSVGLQP